jgi:hypothetical protein
MRQRHLVRGSWLVAILAALVLGGVLGSSDIATAAVSGPTITDTDGLCMQRIFLGSDTATVASSNALNCTAEDIKIATVTSGKCVGTIADGCFSESSCIKNQTFTLDATFLVNVTSANRYDATFFFRTDGTSETQIIKGQAQEVGAYGSGQNASGACSMSWLNPTAGAPVQNLDSDACGDLNQGSLSVNFLIPDVLCTSPDDTNIHLPYCTSWHNNLGTVCNAADDGSDGDKFTHAPDTKSKCTCGDLIVPITVRDLAGSVAKVATQALVTYQVTVTNNSGFATKLTALSDTIYGNIGSAATTGFESNNCPAKIGTTIADGGTAQCEFVIKHVNHTPQAADNVTNTVTATLEDASDPNNSKVLPGATTKVTIDLNKP